MEDYTAQCRFQVCEQYFKRIEDKLDTTTEYQKEHNINLSTRYDMLAKEIYGGDGNRGILSRLDLHRYAILVLATIIAGVKAISSFW